jgi:hypothetical protein
VLDEIGELPREVQARLLVVLEQKTFNKTGDADVLRTDQEVLAATNRQNALRSDVFHRFASFEVPPLFERRGDVLYYLAALDKDVVATLRSWEVLSLLAHNWPGGVREIETVVDQIKAHRSLLQRRMAAEDFPRKADLSKEYDELLENWKQLREAYELIPERAKKKSSLTDQLTEEERHSLKFYKASLEDYKARFRAARAKRDMLEGMVSKMAATRNLLCAPGQEWIKFLPLYVDLREAGIDMKHLEKILNSLKVGMYCLKWSDVFSDFSGLKYGPENKFEEEGKRVVIRRVKECEPFRKAFEGLQVFCLLFFQSETADYNLFDLKDYHKNTPDSLGLTAPTRQQLKKLDLAGLMGQIVQYYLLGKDSAEETNLIDAIKDLPLSGSIHDFLMELARAKKSRVSLHALLELPHDKPGLKVNGADSLSIAMKYDELVNLYQLEWLKRTGWDFHEMEEKTGIDSNTLRNRFPNTIDQGDFKGKDVRRFCDALDSDLGRVRESGDCDDVKWLKNVLDMPDLCDRIIKVKGDAKYSPYVEDLLERTLSSRQNEAQPTRDATILLRILNRLLLEETYPDMIRVPSKVGQKH